MKRNKKPQLLLILAVSPLAKYLTREGAMFPPLSLAYLAGMTPNEWDIEIIDENREVFRYKKADLVGISSFSQSIPRAYEIAKIYKEQNIPVVMGGPHVSFMPEEALQYCSSVVIGEAEGVWAKLLNDFQKGKLQAIYSAPKPNLSEGINAIPRRDIYSRKYKYSWEMVQTARGCPLKCKFCTVTSLFGSTLRMRPIEEVLDELATIRQRYIFFCDDNFVGVTPKQEERAIELLRKMYERKIRKKWACQTSINAAFNEKLLHWMEKTGCLFAIVGFESLSKEQLIKLNKRFYTRFDYRKAIDNFHRHRICSMGSFIIGLENQTFEEIKQIIDFCAEVPVHVPILSVASPFPGTKWWDELRSYLKYSDFPDDYEIVTSGFFPSFENKCLTRNHWKAIGREISALYSGKKIIKSALYWAFLKKYFLAVSVFFMKIEYARMFNKTRGLRDLEESVFRDKLAEIKTRA